MSYNVLGWQPTLGLAVTTTIDKGLIAKYGFSKNYISLTAFWGTVAFKAIKNLHSSEVIPAKYKPWLYTLFSAISISMIYSGRDLFADDLKIKPVLKSISLSASFFDKNKTFENLNKEFDKSYVNGLLYGAKNIKTILTNKFILFTFLEQGIKVSEMYFTARFFPNITKDKIILIARIKEEKSMKCVIESISVQFIIAFKKSFSNALSNKLKSITNKIIAKELRDLILEEKNIQTVMKMSNKHIADAIGKINEGAYDTLINYSTKLLYPNATFNNYYLVTRNKNLMDNYAGFYLLDCGVKALFNRLNFQNIKDTFVKLRYKDNNQSQENSRLAEDSFNNNGINLKTYYLSVAFRDFEEMNKRGIRNYLLEKISDDAEQSQSEVISKLKNDLSCYIHCSLSQATYDLAFILQILAYNIPIDRITDVDSAIFKLNNYLFPPVLLIDLQHYESIIDYYKPMLETLRNPTNWDAERKLSDSNALKIENYILLKSPSQEVLINIPELTFVAGKRYAITGTIGTGKTTFLADLAKCLNYNFSSKGTIYYPTFEGKELPLILCDTEIFELTGASLYLSATYRVQPLLNENEKLRLLPEVKDLYHLFCPSNKENFTEANLLATRKGLGKNGDEVKAPLSTGQRKITILINAILYKKYINKPVVFLMDETLANLDKTTTKIVCDKLKETFSDSIVISVDHGAEDNAFYTDIIDFNNFKVTDTQPTLLGDIEAY
jgi:ABC-type lipoprotein export system ATPase subunit